MIYQKNDQIFQSLSLHDIPVFFRFLAGAESRLRIFSHMSFEYLSDQSIVHDYGNPSGRDDAAKVKAPAHQMARLARAHQA